ncbi:hypothetical protein S40285_10453 [Stachybotrys chlorohalonatus IBT 40285]|uniref:Uncharacterized protein n=1 Tax=Stachybotrys chlorohalonatus (strain IBT 40285) TaxID=1283841 RepID=A0A084QE72_STAC4|nr:hypothetical protein S40285_10453 [Stachybotrys chlorohalonata IBT 40285]
MSDVQGDMLRGSNSAEAQDLYSKALGAPLKFEEGYERERLLYRTHSTLGNSPLALDDVETSLKHDEKDFFLQGSLLQMSYDYVYGNALALVYIIGRARNKTKALPPSRRP